MEATIHHRRMAVVTHKECTHLQHTFPNFRQVAPFPLLKLSRNLVEDDGRKKPKYNKRIFTLHDATPPSVLVNK